MVDSTRSKTTLDRLEEALAKLTSSHLHITGKLDDLLNRVAVLENTPHPTPSPSSSSANPVIPTHPLQPHRLKLEVPRFDGTDPSGWVFKISQFFEYHSVPDLERLTIASFYMDGPALAWFQWMARNHQLPTWTGFLQAIEARFAHSPYEDPTGQLFKLMQKGSVRDYLTQFEALANRITGLSPSSLLSCFISGLDPAIRREVQALQPLTMVHAAGLARLQEEKFQDTQRNPRIRPSFPSSPSTPLSFSTPSPPSPLPLLPSPAKPPPLPVKRLSPEELASHRERGLCFYCDNKFTRGHRCSSRFFLLIADDDTGDAPLKPNIEGLPHLPNSPLDPVQAQPDMTQPDILSSIT